MTETEWARRYGSPRPVKASSLLAVIAIWSAVIPAVVHRPDAWWTLVFAFLATCNIGIPPWRRLGFGRMVVVMAAWGAAALALRANQHFAWVSIFAFLSTLTAVHNSSWWRSPGGAFVTASAWLTTGAVLYLNNDPGGAWICIFAFLTGATVMWQRVSFGTLLGIAAWAGAGALMIMDPHAYGWAVGAFLVSTGASHMFGFRMFRHFEWDLFERDRDPFATSGSDT